MKRKLTIKPQPDYARMDAVLRRQVPDRVPVFELYSNIQQDVLDLAWEPDASVEKRLAGLDRRDEPYRNHVRYMHMMGYDYINLFADNFDFPMNERESTLTREGPRAYVNSHSVTITGWQDFERYPWPDAAAADLSRFERAPGFLPEGMQVIAWTSGILEFVMWLLGYEGISYLLSDNEALVAAMFEAVGSRLVRHYDDLASFDCVGAVAMGDDMGFKTATMLSPQVYRKYLFPWYKKLVDAAHRHGKPAILHSCGNLDAVMEDVIACGWDAKHSFEDAIEPVWVARKKYGSRIALLGGFDLDKLTRMKEEDVRKHTRFLMDACSPGGGWAMGTGNSVPEYIPASNFLAMMEEALR